ncbi:NADH-quinone oxidoreductase subunit N, partial [candidate division KSB1 bacterium]|nr:NADH-quinone oxidoreductase subunit N [candidate division KSB1 bacterium]
GGPAFYWLAEVGLLNSVVALYYYARVVRAMFLEKSEDEAVSLTVSPYYVTLLAVLVIPTLVLGVYWAPLADLANYSVEFLRAL